MGDASREFMRQARRQVPEWTPSQIHEVLANQHEAGEFIELRLYRNPQCPTCGEDAHPENLPIYAEFCAVPAR